MKEYLIENLKVENLKDYLLENLKVENLKDYLTEKPERMSEKGDAGAMALSVRH